MPLGIAAALDGGTAAGGPSRGAPESALLIRPREAPLRGCMAPVSTRTAGGETAAGNDDGDGAGIAPPASNATEAVAELAPARTIIGGGAPSLDTGGSDGSVKIVVDAAVTNKVDV